MRGRGMLQKHASRVCIPAFLVAVWAVAGLTPANAGTVTWDFLTGAPNPSTGNQPSPQTFTDTLSLGYHITAYGITGASNLAFGPTVGDTVNTTVNWIPTNLWIKNGGGSENGLGLANDASGDHEITAHNLVEIDTTTARAQGLTIFSFKMGSSTNNEGWDVFGSNDGTSLTVLFSDGTDQSTHSLGASIYKYYYFTYDGKIVDDGQGDNVLLNLFNGSCGGPEGACAPPPPGTPLPAALPLFASGTGVLGLLAWRRKRRIARRGA